MGIADLISFYTDMPPIEWGVYPCMYVMPCISGISYPHAYAHIPHPSFLIHIHHHLHIPYTLALSWHLMHMI